MDLGYDLEEALRRRSNNISRKSIEALRNAIAKSNLVPKSITDKQLALFIDASDGQIDVAKKTIETYYDARHNAPEHFLDRDPLSETIEQCLNNQHYFILPPKDGCPIIFHQLANSKPSNYYFDNAIKTFFMSIDICLHKYGPQRGIIFLFDMRNVRIGHLTRVRVGTIRKFFRYVQEGMPAKLCEIHVLNVVSFFDKILSLIRPFMRAEIFKMLHTYSSNYNMDDFYKNVISNRSLPKEFGGDLASAEELHDQFRKEFIALREYFLGEVEQRKEFSGESGVKPVEESEIVNTFRKLDID